MKYYEDFEFSERSSNSRPHSKKFEVEGLPALILGIFQHLLFVTDTSCSLCALKVIVIGVSLAIYLGTQNFIPTEKSCWLPDSVYD